jgi:hypothetical protein
LAETSAKLTQANKATALSALILESQQTAAGKAERQQGSLAISADKAKAAFTNQAAVIGNQLVPSVKGVLDVVTGIGPVFAIAAAGSLLLSRRLASSAAANGGFVSGIRNTTQHYQQAVTAQAAYNQNLQRVSLGMQRITPAFAAQQNALQRTITSSTLAAAANTGLSGSLARLAVQYQTSAVGASAFGRAAIAAGLAARATAAAATGLLGALGGPWGIAIAAVTIGLGLLYTSNQKNTAAMKQAKAETKDYARSIAELNGVVTQSTRQSAAKFLVDRGLAAQADRAGFSIERLTDAYAGNKESLELLNAQLESRERYLKAALDAEVAANGKGTEHYKILQEQYAQTTKLQTAFGKYSAELSDASNRQDLMNRAMGGGSKDAGLLRDRWQEAKEALEDYTQANERLTGGLQSSLDARIAEQEAIDDLTESIKENGKTLDIGTEKGRANVSAVRDRIQAAYDLAEAEVQQTGRVSAATQARIDNLRKELTQMGFNKDQIEALLATYRRIPPEVATQVRILDGAESINELSKVGQAALNMIAQYNLSPAQAFSLAQGRDPRAVFGQGYSRTPPPAAASSRSTSAARRQAFAYGGRVLGEGGPRADNQVIAASPDEYVIQQPSARKLGYDVLDFINSHGEIPQFADGGRVNRADAVRSFPSWGMLMNRSREMYAAKEKELKAAQMMFPGAGGGPGGRGYQWQMNVLRQQFPGLPMLSGYRANAVTLSGGKSWHGRDGGRAVDLPPREDVARWIHQTYGANTLELITPYQKYNLSRGRPHTYTGAVWNQHNFAGGNAHDHWAYDQGGVMNPKDIGQNLGRHPEAILNSVDYSRFKALAGGGVPIRLDDYSINKIAQLVSTRPAQLEIDGQMMAEKVFNHLELN